MPKGADYTAEDLQKAIEAVARGMSHKSAALNFHVPRSTLLRKLNEESSDKQRRGPKPVLGEETEEAVVAWIKKMASMGFPITRNILLQTGQQLAKVAEHGGNERAGDIVSAEKWLRLFLERHRDVSLRTAEHVSNAQANVTEADIREFYSLVESRLIEQGFSDILSQPQRIFNTDETGMALKPAGGKVLAARGARNVYSRGGSNKANVTVLVTGSAAGILAPTAIVLRRKTLPSSLTDLVNDKFCLLNSAKGWMTGEVFKEYLEKHFKPFLQREGIEFPVLLFLDNLRCHLTMTVTDFCEENEIILLPLLSNTTHILQPLDVAVFKPLKSLWYQDATIWRIQNGGRPMTKEEFIVLVQTTFSRYRGEWLIAGFRACGISPWDVDAIDYSKCRCPDKGNAPPDSEPSSRENTAINFLMDLEERMTYEQLAWFRQQEPGEPWRGPECLRALYDIWSAADLAVRETLPEAESSQSQDEELTQEDILSVPLPHDPRRR